MTILETDRLRLRELVLEDAPFILRLVNEPAWLEFIGDKGVRTLEDARGYLESGPLAMYERCGFGLYLTERKGEAAPLGVCGLIRRETLADVDIGFAFLPEFWGRGYAFEAASAVLMHGRQAFGLARIVAITSPHNESSIRLLGKLGMQLEGLIEHGGGPVKLFARAF